MRRMSKIIGLAVGALSTLWTAPALAQEPVPTGDMSLFETFASLRELDRKCRFLSFYERVDLIQAMEEARRNPPIPDMVPSGQGKAGEQALRAQGATLNTAPLQRQAEARADTLECGTPQADAVANTGRVELYGQTATLLRHPLLLQHLKQEAETAPLKWQSANAIFGQMMTRFGEQREPFLKSVDSRVQESMRAFGPNLPKVYFNRLDGLAAAGINEAAASQKKFAWVYRSQREVRAGRYDWVRAQDMAAGGARMALAETLRVSGVDESGGATLSSAVGMYGINADGRILVMVNSAAGQGALPDDLRATLLFRSATPSGSRWDRRSWRNGVSDVKAQRLQDEECPAERCFVFPEKATDELAYIVNRPTYSLEFEVYLGAGKAFPPPQESEAPQRNYLGGLIPLLRER